MIKAAGPFANFLRRTLPTRIVERLEANDLDSRTSEAEHDEWVKLLKSQLLRVGLYGVILTALIIGSKLLLIPTVAKILPDASHTLLGIIDVSITLGLMLPFLLEMVTENRSMRQSSRALLQRNRSNVWLLLSISLMKMAVATVFIFMVLASSFTINAWGAVIVVLVTIAVFFLFIKKSYHRYLTIENRFMDNLNKKEEMYRRKSPVTVTVNEKLSVYDIRSMVEVVSPDYPYIGSKLKDLPLKADTGVNIVKIQRGSRSIDLPLGDEAIYPYDKLLAVGTAEQLERFANAVRQQAPSDDYSESEFSLEKQYLAEDSEFVGKTLRELDLRKKGEMVISVIRDNKPIANPSPEFVFCPGDLVWIAESKS